VRICEKCHRESDEKSTFCIKCGGRIIEWKPDSENRFVLADEKEIIRLGSGYFGNILSENVFEKGTCILTERRIYFCGKGFYGTGNGFIGATLKQIVDIQDVTGTGFCHITRIIPIIIGIILMIFSAILQVQGIGALWILFFAVGIALVIYGIVGAQKIFFIEYAGGVIRFSTALFPEEKIADFQNAIHRVKEEKSVFK